MPTDKPFEVLIVEDNIAPARNIARRLTERGCNCTLIVRRHLNEFIQEFDALYPQGFEPSGVKKFDGTVLDVIFHSYEGEKQTGGGFELYKYWQERGILPQLGVILVATEGDKSGELFRDQDVRLTVKSHSGLLEQNLDDFVTTMDP